MPHPSTIGSSNKIRVCPKAAKKFCILGKPLFLVNCGLDRRLWFSLGWVWLLLMHFIVSWRIFFIRLSFPWCYLHHPEMQIVQSPSMLWWVFQVAMEHMGVVVVIVRHCDALWAFANWWNLKFFACFFYIDVLNWVWCQAITIGCRSVINDGKFSYSIVEMFSFQYS